MYQQIEFDVINIYVFIFIYDVITIETDLDSPQPSIEEI